MLNHALLSNKHQCNEFTASLRRMCETQGTYPVRLRDGFITKVVFRQAVDDGEYEIEAMFHTPCWELVWYLDGSSVKNSELDMIAFGADL